MNPSGSRRHPRFHRGIWLEQSLGELREEVTFLYLAWFLFELICWLMRYRKPLAFTEFGRLFRARVLRRG